MKIVVTGGRSFSDREQVFRILYLLNLKRVATGDANGADALVKQWCYLNLVTHVLYEAFWNRRGKAAGPERNERMLVNEKPDLLVAFAGGDGTEGCIELARKHHIEVMRVVRRLR